MEKKREENDPTGSTEQSREPSKIRLQEFSQLDKLLQMLPQKAQRGLTNLNIEYTCLDANVDFIVLGANIPMVFVYDRKEQQILRFKCDDKNCRISCVRVLTCLDHQLAVGTTSGRVEVYLIPAKLPGHTKEVKKFVVNSNHRGCVTCAEWSTNGMKLFTGDTTGAVVYTEVDFYKDQCTPIKIVNENSPVVQLSYAYKVLIVSTCTRTVLCYTDEKYKLQQAGQQARKSKGHFGAHFIPAICKPRDAKLYAARPGLRLWKVDIGGQVFETIMYKDLISAPHANIQLLPDVGVMTSIKPSLGDLQFGPILTYMESYLVSWCKSFLVILDPSCSGGAAVLASSKGKIGSIMSVTVSENEIFVLRHSAERCLIRISTQPEMQCNKEHMKFSPEELQQLRQLNPPVTLQDDSKNSQLNTTSKIKASFKNFFSKAADELSGDAARFSESIKEGALEIKQKATQLKKDDTKPSELSSEFGEGKQEEVELKEHTNLNEEESKEDNVLSGNTPTASVSKEILQSQCNSNEENVTAVDGKISNSSEQESKEGNHTTKLIMSALATGMQIAGAVAAGSPQQEETSIQETLEVERTRKEELIARKLDDERLQMISQEDYDDVIVQPKPVKKKKKKPKGLQVAEEFKRVGLKREDAQNRARWSESDCIKSEVNPPTPVNGDKPGSKLVYYYYYSKGAKKEMASNTNGIKVSNYAENGQKTMSPEHSNKDALGVVTTCNSRTSSESRDTHSVNQKRTEQVFSESTEDNSPSAIDQIEQLNFHLDESRDVTSSGSDAKSLVTPHGSVAEQHAFTCISEEVPLTVINENDCNFGMVTALASSEPSKPRHQALARSYPGEVSESDLPRTLQSFDIEGNMLHDQAENVNPPLTPNVLVEHVVIKPGLASNTPLGFDTSVATAPDQFQVDDMLTKDSTEELMGDPHKGQPVGTEYDFYTRYRTPTALPLDASPSADTQDMTSSGESIEDLPVPENIQQKLAGSWMQCTVPGFITQLLVSDKNVWCIDNHDKIYHTPVNSVSYKWSRLRDSGMQIAMSPSEKIVWRVHRRTNIAYASSPITPRSQVGAKWDVACKDVAHVCLDENIAWIIKTNDSVCVHKNISWDHPFAQRTVQVDSNMHIEQIAANRGVVWALTTNNMVVFRTDISLIKQQGRLWRELTDSFHLKAVCIALDGRNNGWAIDEDGIVWFRTGVTADTPQGDEEKWWQVPMGEYLMQDPNMLGFLLTMAGTTAMDKMDKVTGQLTGWIKKLSPIYRATHLAASSAGVWVCGAHHYKSTMHVSTGNLLGSRWEQACPIGLASSIIWNDVSAGGVYANSGRIWALKKGGEMFCYPPDSRKPHLVEPPVAISFKQLSATPDAVWGLDNKGAIFIRMGVSERHPHGVVWRKLNLSQLGARKVVYICCGTSVVWACDHEGGLHFRIGVSMPQVESLPPAWVPVDGKPAGYNTFFTQVACGGSSDSSVWAVDNRRNVYVRKGISENLPIGTEWEPVEGTLAQQICISSNNVWALCPNGDIACRFGVTEKNPMGDYWKKVPGNFAFLNVSQSDDLWAINNEGQLFQRFTKMFQRHQCGVVSSPDPDEWELL